MAYIIGSEEVGGDGPTHIRFRGEEHGADVCILVAALAPGEGTACTGTPAMRVFVLHEGRATFTAGNETRETGTGQVVVSRLGCRTRSSPGRATPRYLRPLQPAQHRRVAGGLSAGQRSLGGRAAAHAVKPSSRTLPPTGTLSPGARRPPHLSAPRRNLGPFVERGGNSAS